jgi:hypothetical protein
VGGAIAGALVPVFALPVTLIGPASELVHTLYVRPALERIFDYRRQVYTRLFGGIQPGEAHALPRVSASEENTA